MHPLAPPPGHGEMVKLNCIAAEMAKLNFADAIVDRCGRGYFAASLRVCEHLEHYIELGLIAARSRSHK